MGSPDELSSYGKKQQPFIPMHVQNMKHQSRRTILVMIFLIASVLLVSFSVTKLCIATETLHSTEMELAALKRRAAELDDALTAVQAKSKRVEEDKQRAEAKAQSATEARDLAVRSAEKTTALLATAETRIKVVEAALAAAESKAKAEEEARVKIEEEARVAIEAKTAETDERQTPAGDCNKFWPIMHEADGIRPLFISIASHPRHDLLGAFSLPSIFLLSLCRRYGWAMEILPFKGSRGEQGLKYLVSLGENIPWDHVTSFLDANHRKDYDPVELNAVAHDMLGFFPEQPDQTPPEEEWISVKEIPPPGPKMEKLCQTKTVPGNGYLRCRIWIDPELQVLDTQVIQNHMANNGGVDSFFDSSFRNFIHRRYMEKNQHRLKYYGLPQQDKYNIAVHIRRGDATAPDRITPQKVFASVARRLCNAHPGAAVHVFSAGKMHQEEDWKTMEEVADTCGSVSIHIDDNEFDAWAHFVAADALVISKSTFSYVPALLSLGEVHYPATYWSPKLSHWKVYDTNTGDAVLTQ